MKQFYPLMLAVLFAGVASAQCTIDTTLLPPGTGAAFYPAPNHLPHIVRNAAYDQTIQGRIPDTMTMNFAGFISASVRVDSVRLDSIAGLPNGISWVKNPNVLRGGGYGCVSFTGTTSDTAGRYNIRAFGMQWVHLEVPLVGINVDTAQYGSLNRIPPFNNYYVTVDSAQLPLSVTTTGNNLCYGETTGGTVTATAHGGSPVSPYTYLWNTGSTKYTLTDIGPGSYTVTVYSGADSATATATVNVQPSPITLTVTTDSARNGNDGWAIVVATGGVPPYDFFWTGGRRNDTITDLDPGTYRVTVVDSFNCIARDSGIVYGLETTGISAVIRNVSAFNLFPNPANSQLNVWIETTTTANAVLDILDVTGRVIYSNPITLAQQYSTMLDVERYQAGSYMLRLTVEGSSVSKHFVVSH